jgi:hypothetical protein
VLVSRLNGVIMSARFCAATAFDEAAVAGFAFTAKKLGINATTM